MAYTKRIEIQVLTETQDEIGQEIAGWTRLSTVWAEVSCIGGREYYSAAQTNSENDMKFRIRYTKMLRDYLSSEIRIIYGGRIFNVVHIDDYNEQHRVLVMRARELNGVIQRE